MAELILRDDKYREQVNLFKICFYLLQHLPGVSASVMYCYSSYYHDDWIILLCLQQIKETPEHLARLLSLLDRVDGKEGGSVLLQLISTIGENEVNALQIGRQDGFRKMLRLLLLGDDDLSRQLLKILQHFVEMVGHTGEAVEKSMNSLGTGTESSKAIAGLDEGKLTSKATNMVLELGRMAFPKIQSLIKEERITSFASLTL